MIRLVALHPLEKDLKKSQQCWLPGFTRNNGFSNGQALGY